jgi:hypothetical protein
MAHIAGDNVLLAQLRVQPLFSLKRATILYGGRKPDSITVGCMLKWHTAWLPLLRAVRLDAGSEDARYIALWLPKSVEKAVDDAWNSQPGHGFLLHGVAIGLCMGALALLAPKVARHGCSPLPLLAPLEAALRESGFPLENSRPVCRYPIVTGDCLENGCRACMLDKDCCGLSAPVWNLYN